MIKQSEEAYTSLTKKFTSVVDEYAKWNTLLKTGNKQEQLDARTKLMNLNKEYQSYAAVADKLKEYGANLDSAKGVLLDLNDQQKALNAQIATTQNQLKAITGMKSKVGSFMKSVASTVG